MKVDLKKTMRPLVLALLTLSLTATLAAAETLGTEVGLLVGRPPADGGEQAAEGVLVVPGIVIPAASDSRLDDVLGKAGGEKEARVLARNTRLKQVARSLADSLRLGDVEVRYQMRLDLSIDDLEDLPSPSATSNVHISVRLLGYNDTAASYEVHFYQGSKPITKTPLTVQRGKQAVVGGLDGPDAPYLFLTISPDAAGSAGEELEPIYVAGDVKPPIAIAKKAPAYTPEAREKRVQGVVIVRAIIDKKGKVTSVKLLRGLPHGLSESAMEAVRTWTYEPATLDGEPVEVYYNLTINFRLAELEEEGKE